MMLPWILAGIVNSNYQKDFNYDEIREVEIDPATFEIGVRTRRAGHGSGWFTVPLAPVLTELFNDMISNVE